MDDAATNGDAIGGLDIATLLAAYQRGWFPMADGRHSLVVRWYEPKIRAIIPLDERFHVPHGLRKLLKHNPFSHLINGDFSATIRACAAREDTWINDKIIAAYENLHLAGYAHSVESWQDGKLVGGLYGLALGGVFCGESMFSTVSNASKAALVYLVSHLRNRGFMLLDSQISNDHLKQFGMVEMPQHEYVKMLEIALQMDCAFMEPEGD